MPAKRFEINRRTSASSGTVACWELFTGSVECRVFEIGIVIVAATTSVFGLGRPAAIGLTPTTPAKPLSNDGGQADLCRAKTAIAWATGPTVPVNFIRQASLPATIGAGVTWRFDRGWNGRQGGLLIPVGGSLIVWNTSAVSLADIYVTIEE